jgi:hypothetical protein
MTRRDEQDAVTRVVPRKDIEAHLDDLRRAIGRVEALADSAVRAYGDMHEALVDERVAHLIDMTSEAAFHALEEVDRMRLAVSNPVPAAEIWER